MTQIQRDGQTDGRRVEKLGGTLQKAAYGSPPKNTSSPTCLVSKEPSSTVFRSLTSLPNKAHKTSAGVHAAPLMVLHVYTTVGLVYMHVPAWTFAVCLFSPLLHVCCEFAANPVYSTWNIKKWRWRCLCAGIGWGCVMILSRAVHSGNGCLAHPLITSMFPPNSPFTVIPLVFPLSKWPSCLKRFLLLIAGRGVFSSWDERTEKLRVVTAQQFWFHRIS